MKFGIFETKRTWCLYYRSRYCIKFGISGSKGTVRNGEVSVRGGLTVPALETLENISNKKFLFCFTNAIKVDYFNFMCALTGNSDINTSLQERFSGASPGEASLQDVRTLKPLKLDDQHKVQKGLTEVEAERQNSVVHQISYGNEKIVPIYNEKYMKTNGTTRFCVPILDCCCSHDLLPQFYEDRNPPVQRRILVTDTRKALV